MNEENDCDHNVDGEAVEGSVVCVGREEVLQALNEMKTGIDLGHSEITLELIAASRGVGIKVLTEICHRVLDGFACQLNGL